MKVTAISKIAVDRSKFLSRIDTKRQRILAMTGGFGRKIVARSIRNRKSVSKPGKPPRNATGVLKSNIGFVVDDDTVTVGPIKLRYAGDKRLVGVTTVPELLEFGGAEKVIQGGREVIAKYEPRPYVGPKLEATADQLAKLIDRIGLT